MARTTTDDLDYLAARLHGRRGRLAEAERLDALCRLRTIPDLARAVLPEGGISSAAEFQGRLVRDLAGELFTLARQFSGPRARLLEWMPVRFELENLKVLVRGLLTHEPLDEVRRHLIPLPPELEARPSSAETLPELVEELPRGAFQESLARAAVLYREEPGPFFYEAALDRGYFLELLARLAGLSGEVRGEVAPVIFQEVDIFHLMLVVRGRFLNGLEPALLAPLHVGGTRIELNRFKAMLQDPGLPAAAGRAVGRAVDRAPVKETAEPVLWEALAWERFLRLADRAFRRGHMSFGAVVGYAALKRVEAANLITLAEGIRMGVPGETLRPRLIPRSDLEAASA